MDAGAGRALDRLSFRRITDIPFETYVAVLENWQHIEHGDELRIGQSQLRGPIEHDRDSGTYRIAVRLAAGLLAAGLLRRPLRMRLNIDRWSWLPARTALELIPCERVWPTRAYFRAGHLLMDSLTRSVPQHMPTQHVNHVPARQATRTSGLTQPDDQTGIAQSSSSLRTEESERPARGHGVSR